MQYPRLAGVVLAMTVAVGGTVAGCGSADPAGTGGTPAAATPAATSAAPDPKTALQSSVTGLGTTAYTFKIKQAEASGEGTVDPGSKSAVLSITGKAEGQTFSIGYTVIGPDLWMKVDFGAAANQHFGINKTQWMHIDQSKVKDKTQLPLDANGNLAIGADTMLDKVADVKRADGTHFTGTVDVTDEGNLLSPAKEVLTKVGDKAKVVPFTATLDDKGRLTQLKVDGTTIDPGLSLELTFAGFGSAQTITKPAGAIPAPAAVYTGLFS